MTIAVVLDSSALVAYAGLDMAVSELIMMVTEEGDDVAVPGLCLLDACDKLVADEARRLKQLTERTEGPTVVTLPLVGDQIWPIVESGDPHHVAQAFAESSRHRAVLATFHADHARRDLGDKYVLDLGLTE